MMQLSIGRTGSSIMLLLLLQLLAMGADALEMGYYASTCPDAEAIVRDAMERQHYADPTLSPAIIRMLFHDCFVRGCDASVMIVPTRTRSSERVAVPNQTLRGFNAVDAVKRALEAACPATVSCADALALMARDAVALLGGSPYDVPLGRRDGLQSNPSEVDLPPPFTGLDNALAAFAARGFSVEETVVLFGAHTVGGAHCGSFRYRLTRPDGTMDDQLRGETLATCGADDLPVYADPVVFLDPGTPFTIDNGWYGQMMNNRSLLQVDQEAGTHQATAPHVAFYAANSDGFMHKFSEVMVKLSNVGVLEGDAGEVRKICSRYNT